MDGRGDDLTPARVSNDREKLGAAILRAGALTAIVLMLQERHGLGPTEPAPDAVALIANGWKLDEVVEALQDWSDRIVSAVGHPVVAGLLAQIANATDPAKIGESVDLERVILSLAHAVATLNKTPDHPNLDPGVRERPPDVVEHFAMGGTREDFAAAVLEWSGRVLAASQRSTAAIENKGGTAGATVVAPVDPDTEVGVGGGRISWCHNLATAVFGQRTCSGVSIRGGSWRPRKRKTPRRLCATSWHFQGAYKMGRRGPLAKPELRAVKGTARKGDPTEAPKLRAGEVPPMPEWLGPEARAEWERVVPLLEADGRLVPGIGPTVAAFCGAVARLEIAERALADGGGLVQAAGPNGYRQQRPEVAIAQKAAAEILKIGSALGVNPAGDARLPRREQKPDRGDLATNVRRLRLMRAESYDAKARRELAKMGPEPADPGWKFEAMREDGQQIRERGKGK